MTATKCEKNLNERFFLVLKIIFCCFLGAIVVLCITSLVHIINGDLPDFEQIFTYNRGLFSDFFEVNRQLDGNNPYFGKGSSYPPLAIIFAYPFYILADYSGDMVDTVLSFGGIFSYFLFLGIFAVCVVLLAVCVYKKYSISKKDLVLLVLLFFVTHPLFYAFQRGNYIIYSFLAICFYLLFFGSNKKHMQVLAYIALAIATAFKIYPAIFGIFSYKKRDYKGLFLSAMLSIILLILPFFLFKNGLFNSSKFLENLLGFTKFGFVELPFDGQMRTYNRMINSNISFTNFIQLLYIFAKGGDPLVLTHEVYKLGVMLSFIFFSLIIVGLLLTKSSWKIAALCVIAMASFPNPSYRYVYVFLYIAFTLFLLENKKTKIDIFYFVLFLIIFIPINLPFILPPQDGGNFQGVRLNIILTMLASITMAISIITTEVISLLSRSTKKLNLT